MHWLANYFEENDSVKDLYDFDAQLEAIGDASTIQLSLIDTDFRVLKNELKVVEREVEQASGDGKERFETKMKLFLRDAKKGSEAFENDVENLWKTLSGLIQG